MAERPKRAYVKSDYRGEHKRKKQPFPSPCLAGALRRDEKAVRRKGFKRSSTVLYTPSRRVTAGYLYIHMAPRVRTTPLYSTIPNYRFFTISSPFNRMSLSLCMPTPPNHLLNKKIVKIVHTTAQNVVSTAGTSILVNYHLAVDCSSLDPLQLRREVRTDFATEREKFAYLVSVIVDSHRQLVSLASNPVKALVL